MVCTPLARDLVPNEVPHVRSAVAADAETVYRIARGDKAALAELYQLHGPRLLAFAQRLLGDRREGEDLLHDLFVEVWKTAGQYDPARGNVRAWLLMRLRSRGLDRLRAKRDRPNAQGPEVETAPLSAPQPRELDRRRACSALDALHPDKRRVVELGYFEGLSTQQIAVQLGIPVGTVKSRTAAALAELRHRLSASSNCEVES